MTRVVYIIYLFLTREINGVTYSDATVELQACSGTGLKRQFNNKFCSF
jgi:hypothetical protein